MTEDCTYLLQRCLNIGNLVSSQKINRAVTYSHRYHFVSQNTDNLAIELRISCKHNIFSIFTVTTTPAEDEILLQSSESVELIGFPSNAKETSDSTILIAIVIAVLSAAILLLVALGVLRKRRQGKMSKGHEANEYFNENPTGGTKTNGYQNVAPITEPETSRFELSQEVIYQNDDVHLKSVKRSETDIPMPEFESAYNVLQENEGADFAIQFEKLTKIAKTEMGTVEFASDPNFKAKNRYKNILPFDNTRVVIKNNEDGYINACFIDGFEQKRKFIATQGPLKTTVQDFWFMVLQQKCTVIVMLAKCVEAGKQKCEKYWPDYSKNIEFGPVAVSNLREVRSCGFVCRTLKVTAQFEDHTVERIVSQYHFLKWPDHGFPATTSYITRMHRAVMKTQTDNRSNSPIVVHCSAGAGRTGTFIGYDILLNESTATGNADVYECALKMRNQRVEMVQNCDQYILLHKLVLESYLFGDTDVSGTGTQQTFAEISYKTNAMVEQFRNVSRVHPMDISTKDMLGKISAYNRMRVVSYDSNGDTIGLPLEASYVEAYDESSTFIVSRTPTPSQLDAFWAIVLDANVSIIVNLLEKENDSCKYWLNQKFYVDRRDVRVLVESEETMKHLILRRMKIVGVNTRSITQIHVQMNEGIAQPKSISKINDAIVRLQNELRESSGVALIHCSDGVGLSGIFCATMNLIERLKVENMVDVFRTVKDLQDCKKGLVSSMEQYEFCHQAVVEYLHNFDTYSNFQ